MQFEREKIKIVTCNLCAGGEHGERADCVKQIKKIVESGKVAYMIYSEHVREKVEELGYEIYGQSINGITVGMYITKCKKDVKE